MDVSQLSIRPFDCIPKTTWIISISFRYYFMLRKKIKKTKSDIEYTLVRQSVFGSNEARIAIAKNVSKADQTFAPILMCKSLFF